DFCERTRTNIMAPPGKLVGGLDFGFRNPFAALWGACADDVLYIENEVYLRETPISEIIKRRLLPRNVLWHADPAGAAEIEQLRLAGYKVLRGKNDIRAGIAAVTARLQSGRLKVHEWRCPNLLAEARLYRYPSPQERALVGENPVDEHNHALGA